MDTGDLFRRNLPPQRPRLYVRVTGDKAKVPIDSRLACPATAFVHAPEMDEEGPRFPNPQLWLLCKLRENLSPFTKDFRAEELYEYQCSFGTLATARVT
jgi:hypothetical protein